MFKTKEQIEEMAKEIYKYSTPETNKMFSIQDYCVGYTQAQKDLLESASANGMDYWGWYRGVDTSTFMGSLELAGKDGYEAGWKACALSKVKELQEKDEEIKELKEKFKAERNDVLYMDKRVLEEKEKYQKAVNDIEYLTFKIKGHLTLDALEELNDKIRTKYGLVKQESKEWRHE